MEFFETSQILNYLFDFYKDATLSKFAIALLSLISLNKIFSLMNSRRLHFKAIEEGKLHKSKRDKKIHEFLEKYQNSISKELEKKIISLDASTLLKEIHCQRITSYQAVLTYCIRAARHGKENNWITEVLFEEALEQAISSDKRIKQNNENDKPNLPLDGLPLSIKDNFNVKNHFSTIGLCNFTTAKNSDGSLTYLCMEDGYFVKVMKEKGAVIYVKTNTPQNMLAVESTNRLWGATKNPWNEKKTCGGSTGGEAGLVGAFCSPIGIGTDIGGSIRIPSVYCGIYGFKPTATRLTKLGFVGLNGCNFNSNLSVMPTLGPMARSADDLVFMMKHLYGSFTNDFYCNNKPFDYDLFMKGIEIKQGSKPKIAFLNSMKYCELAPELLSALEDIKGKLSDKGYECEEFVYDFSELINVGTSILINSGTAEGVTKTLGAEKSMPYYEKYFQVRKTPNFIIKLMSWFWRIKGNDRMATMAKCCLNMNQEEFLQAIQRFQQLKFEFVNNFNLQNFQAIVCPVLPFYAPDIGTGDKAVSFIDLSFLFNVTDMPSGVVPIRLSQGLNYIHNKNDDCTDFLKDSISIKGMPVCVQVATLPGKDELSLKLLKEIDEFYRFDKNFMPNLLEKFN